MIENPYIVKEEDIKVGNTYFIFLENGFAEILIGPNVDINNMYVNFYGKRHQVLVQELWSRLPNNYKGSVRYL